MVPRAVALAALLLLPAALAAPSAQLVAAWDHLAPVPVARTEVAAVAAGGKVYALGGLGAGVQGGSRVDVYDPATNTWALGPPLPIPLHHTQAVAVGDLVLVLGGYNGFTPTFTAVPTTFLLDAALPLEAQAWVPFVPLPEPRGAHGAAFTGEGVYVFGGVTLGGQLLATAWKMPVVAGVPLGAWLPIADLPDPRDHLAGAGLDGKALAVGGRDLGLGSNTGRLDVFDPATGAWTRGPDMPTARGGIAAAVAGGRMFVFGGEGPSGTFPHAEGFSLAGNDWVRAPDLPTKRHGMGAAALGEGIHVVAGGPVPGLTVSAAHERLRVVAP